MPPTEGISMWEEEAATAKTKILLRSMARRKATLSSGTETPRIHQCLQRAEGKAWYDAILNTAFWITLFMYKPCTAHTNISDLWSPLEKDSRKHSCILHSDVRNWKKMALSPKRHRFENWLKHLNFKSSRKLLSWKYLKINSRTISVLNYPVASFLFISFRFILLFLTYINILLKTLFQLF